MITQTLSQVKNILFLHHNFPGQFRFIAKHLDKTRYSVKFLYETNYYGSIAGVEGIQVRIDDDLANASLDGQIRCGNRYKKMFEELQKQQWIPDYIVSHSGWGCGLHSKAVFPNAKLISYLEWWFDDDAEEYSFDANNSGYGYEKSAIDKLRLRNLSVAYELLIADKVISPTIWQANQLPSSIKERVEIIPEGVDTDIMRFNPGWKSNSKLLISYATRGLESMRGYPEFVIAVTKILKENSNVEVSIAGQDKIFYGGKPPAEGSFGKWSKNYFQKNKVLERVNFEGFLSKKDYARLLKRSNIHCYFTRPFVASWSLLDAMSSGCCIVASDVAPVRECAHPQATFFVDHTNTVKVAKVLTKVIELSEKDRQDRGILQREMAIRRWSRSSSLKRWTGLFQE